VRRVRSGGSGDVIAQGDDRQQAGDAGEDEGGFHDPGGDESEGGGLADPLGYRVEDHGGASAGDADDELGETSP
jgi:hypothetical protein